MRQERQAAAEEICQSIYQRTKSFYGEISEGRDDVGFQILYGPPNFKAPILFIGYQPGAGTKSALEEREYGSEDRWPRQSEYMTESWPLARQLLRMFDKQLIEKSVGMNAIFLRANKIASYHKNFDRQLRTQIEQFCIPRVEQIVEAIQPTLIVAIGFATLRLFCAGAIDMTNKKGRVLTLTGKIAGRDALGVLHLSGARISKSDRAAIARHIQSSISDGES
jgi:uracil-DNA glycosylase